MLYVCNYGPAGNFIGEPVYGSGTTVEPLRMPTTRPLRLMWFNKASFIASEVDGEIFGNGYAIQ